MEIRYDIRKYSQGETYKKIDTFLDGLVKEHSNQISNPEKEWNDKRDRMDFKFKVMGLKISGDIKLLEGKLIFSGNLPFPARLYKGRIEETIKENLKKVFP